MMKLSGNRQLFQPKKSRFSLENHRFREHITHYTRGSDILRVCFRFDAVIRSALAIAAGR